MNIRIQLISIRAFFKREQWPLLVIDEGHRLKNPKCQLMAMLRRLHTSSRFLLTGTPVQNNMSEMWSLMNFLLPEIFDEPVRRKFLFFIRDWLGF
jgi:ATP-dependent DNA helicase